MATPARTARKSTAAKEYLFIWEGKDKAGKVVRGEMRAGGLTLVQTTLRRQGITVGKIKKQSFGGMRRISEKDITLFTRQLATMIKSGVPLLQAFDIVGKGSSNPSMSKLLSDIRTDVETGSSLNASFRKHPRQFDPLFCNLVAVGEQAGILEGVLERLADYKEKILAIKGKIKSAMTYPIAVMVIALVITSVIMLFVIPQFKKVFSSFGADLPAPTLFVIALSDAFISYWYIIFGALAAAGFAFTRALRNSEKLQFAVDRLVLQLPIFGPILRKAAVARWTRTLSTMSAAGVPLVESLDSVAVAVGNRVYQLATHAIHSEVSTGSSLTIAMQNTGVFANMVIQMVSIGEEAGQLDTMLGKVADFYEAEVDDAVESLSSLMEPFIMVFLGTLIGGLVVAMYLPIFKIASVV
jgi:type IV pilus assembly protein PilC